LVEGQQINPLLGCATGDGLEERGGGFDSHGRSP
jgi:hypothetical protein